MSERYTPSNGTEGEIFEEVWCDRCQRDRKYREAWANSGEGDPEDGCPILAAAYAGDEPPEWVWEPEQLERDHDLLIGEGGARCTAFEQIPPDHVDPDRELSDEERAAQAALFR